MEKEKRRIPKDEASGLKKTTLGIAAIIVAVAIGLFLKNLSATPQKSVAGESSVTESFRPTIPPDPAPTIRAGVEKKLEDIKGEISNLNVKDVTSSSPQVQKILKDIANLQNIKSLPKDEAKNVCMQICSNL